MNGEYRKYTTDDLNGMAEGIWIQDESGASYMRIYGSRWESTDHTEHTSGKLSRAKWRICDKRGYKPEATNE